MSVFKLQVLSVFRPQNCLSSHPKLCLSLYLDSVITSHFVCFHTSELCLSLYLDSVITSHSVCFHTSELSVFTPYCVCSHTSKLSVFNYTWTVYLHTPELSVFTPESCLSSHPRMVLGLSSHPTLSVFTSQNCLSLIIPGQSVFNYTWTVCFYTRELSVSSPQIVFVFKPGLSVFTPRMVCQTCISHN